MGAYFGPRYESRVRWNNRPIVSTRVNNLTASDNPFRKNEKIIGVIEIENSGKMSAKDVQLSLNINGCYIEKTETGTIIKKCNGQYNSAFNINFQDPFLLRIDPSDVGELHFLFKITYSDEVKFIIRTGDLNLEIDKNALPFDATIKTRTVDVEPFIRKVKFHYQENDDRIYLSNMTKSNEKAGVWVGNNPDEQYIRV